MKSSLVAVSAAVVVATLVTGLKDRAALQEKFGLGSAGKPAPELMMMGRIKPEVPAGNSEFNAQLVADKIEAITSPSPSAPDTSDSDRYAAETAACGTSDGCSAGSDGRPAGTSDTPNRFRAAGSATGGRGAAACRR